MILSQVANLGEMLKIEADDIVSKTKLQDIIDEHSFIVFQPTVHGIPIRASRKKPFRFSFFRNNGIYFFDAVMERSFFLDNLRVCQFKAVSDVRKKQRRSSFRLPVILDATVRLAQPEIDIPGLYASYSVKTSDLSDTGMQFSCFEYFPEGTLINIALSLDHEEEMVLLGRTIRCFTSARESSRFNTSVQFINLPSRDQTRINRFILKTQINQRNRLT